MPPNPIKGRANVLEHTFSTVLYAEPGDELTVLKSGAVWVDGNPYGWRPGAKNPEADLRRESRIYEALGTHDQITKFIRLEQQNGVVWALRLERAPHGSVRKYIAGNSHPRMVDRLNMALDFSLGVVHLHSCEVLWGDLSARNALVFDGLRLKLCDFAGSRLKDVFDDITYRHEIRYRPPLPESERPPLDSMEQELFALGTAIYEITEWRLPYDDKKDDNDVNIALSRGERLVLSSDNPAGDIVQRCWNFQCASAQEVVDALQEAVGTCQGE